MKYTKWAPALVLAGLVAACEQSPAGPNSPLPQFTHGVVTGPVAPTNELLWVCKTVLAGGPAGPYDFDVTVTGGTSHVGATFSLNDGQCIHVATAGPANPAQVVVSENAATLASLGAQLNDISVASVGSVTDASTATTADVTISTGGVIGGAVITFTNEAVPDEGGQGCTPGYWKQPHHFDSWEGYAPGDDFDTVFGTDFFNPDITLEQALNLGGGGLNALARHGVAALLNAANSGVSFDLTEAEVIAEVQKGTEAAKNLLAGFNEQGCPLN